MNLIKLCRYKKNKEKIGWRPKVNIEKGISYLLKDISNWKDAPLWTVKKLKKLQENGFYI